MNPPGLQLLPHRAPVGAGARVVQRCATCRSTGGFATCSAGRSSALPLLSVRFFFHCFLTSPSGQRWHRRHASPFWQPCFFQNHAQGWQSPVPCMSEPAEAAEDRMVALSTRGTSLSSLPPGVACPSPSRPMVWLWVEVERSVATLSFLRVLSSLCGHRWQRLAEMDKPRHELPAVA